MLEKQGSFGDWFERHRLATVGIFLLIIWASIWVLLYLKADEITKDPCTFCAESHGEEVVCSKGKTYITRRIYYPNGSIYDEIPIVQRESIDYSDNLNISFKIVD